MVFGVENDLDASENLRPSGKIQNQIQKLVYLQSEYIGR